MPSIPYSRRHGRLYRYPRSPRKGYHLRSNERLLLPKRRYNIYRRYLGTGNGISVLQLRDAFVKNTGVDVPYVIDPRRPGDPDEVYANAQKAKDVLGWEAKYGIEEMCEDTWRWQKNNPKGYEE